MLKEFIEHIQKTTQPLITTVNGSTFRITDDGMIIGLTEAATMGDARAAKVIIDLIGEEDSQGEAGVEIIDDL